MDFEKFSTGLLFLFCGVSMLSATLVFFSGLIFGSWKSHRGRLVMYIMATEAAAGAEKYFAFVNCTLEAWLCQVAMVSSFFWKLCFAITLYLAVVHSKKDRFLNFLEPFYHIISWGFPLATATICELTHSFGKAGLWCWIKADAPEFRMGFFYIPLVCIMILMLIVYFVMIISIRVRIRKTKHLVADYHFRKELKIYQRLSVFILVFVAGRSWSVVNRTYELVSGQPSDILFLFHTMGSYSQGFFSALVYGAVERYPQRYWALFRHCFKWCKKKIHRKRSSLASSESTDYSRSLSLDLSSSSRNMSRLNSKEHIDADETPATSDATNVLTESLLSREQREEEANGLANYDIELSTAPPSSIVPGDSNNSINNSDDNDNHQTPT